MTDNHTDIMNEMKKKTVEDRNKYYKEFVNKNATSLSEFIINSDLNHYDLHKLAHLGSLPSVDILI